MGLLLFLALNWLLIVAIFGYIKKPEAFRAALRDWLLHPMRNVFLLLWVSSILVAGWGVLSAERLSWPVTTPWGTFKSWQLGGIFAFLGLGIFFVYSAYENSRYWKRLDADAKAKKQKAE